MRLRLAVHTAGLEPPEGLVGAEALRTGARVVIERDKRSSDRAPSFLSHDHDRTYGETVLRYFTFNPDGPDQVTS